MIRRCYNCGWKGDRAFARSPGWRALNLMTRDLLDGKPPASIETCPRCDCLTHEAPKPQERRHGLAPC